MTLTSSEVLYLMKNELACIKRANFCNRDCLHCDLVQEDCELIAAFEYVIKMLEEATNG